MGGTTVGGRRRRAEAADVSASLADKRQLRGIAMRPANGWMERGEKRRERERERERERPERLRERGRNG